MTNYEDASALVFNHIEFQAIIAVAQIELLVENLTLAGVSKAQMLAILSEDLSTGGRIFGSYASGMTTATNLGITGAAQIAEMLTYVNAGYDRFKWVTVSKNPCPQCKRRAGRTESTDMWAALGYPRRCFSVCGPNCKCNLGPYDYVGKSTIILK